MGLYLGEETTGDFMPYLAFNAKSDKWTLNVNKQKTPLKVAPSFIADLENIKTGWFMFQEGAGPDFRFDESLIKSCERPSVKHKRGAKFNVYMKGDHPGVYEFSTNSKNVMNALNKLHDDFEEGKKGNPGKVPVINVGDSIEVKSTFKNQDGSNGSATNYMPVFSIVKWVDRPAELAANESASSPAPVSAAPTGGSEF